VVWEALPKFVRASMLRRWGLCAGGQSACWYTALLALSSFWRGGLDLGVCLRGGVDLVFGVSSVGNTTLSSSMRRFCGCMYVAR
jgi:hypothetical protein